MLSFTLTLLNIAVPTRLAPRGLKNQNMYGFTIKACSKKELEYYAYTCTATSKPNSQIGEAARRLLQLNYNV